MRFNQRHILLLISVVLAVTTLVAYEPVRHNGFVSYDDLRYITKNPNVNGGITRDSVIWAFTKAYSANWHPLTWLSHMLDCEFFGSNPSGHHVISMLLHVANTLLLFWILANMTGSTWASAFVAAVFALHPIQVESVAWAAERKTVLSGLFWLLTIAVYIHYTRQPRPGRYVLLLLVFGLCIMTKPFVVTLPCALLLLDYWPLERIQWGSDTKRSSSARPIPKEASRQKVTVAWLVIEKIPLLVLSAILCVTTFIAQQSGRAVIPLETIPLDQRIANMFVSYIRYIGKIIWPSGLAVIYPHPRANLSNAVVMVCALLFVLISVFSIYVGRRRRYVAVGWLWYVGTLIPMIGLVQVGPQAMADRYMYISILGLLMIAAWAIKDLIANRPRWRVVAAVSAVAILSTAVILTRIQVKRWQNSITLFEYALKVTKDNEIAEDNYGYALFKEGRLDEAVSHLTKGLRINPVYAQARKNLGVVYLRQGKYNEGVACFNELIRRGQGSAEIYYLLGVAMNMQHKYDDAIKYFTTVLKLDPKYPDAHNKMGAALLAVGKTEEAIAYLNEALRTNPDKAEAYANLGKAYSQLDKYEPAIRNWTKAVQLKPNDVGVLNYLAWLLATVDDASIMDANKAIEYAERACELTKHEEPHCLDTLAAAYAAAGRFDDAKDTAEKALNTAKAANEEDLAHRIESRLQLYQAGQPYRQK